MHQRTLTALLLVLVATSAPSARSTQPTLQDALASAKALYESAEYDRALNAIDEMPASGMTQEQTRDRILYRALCLIALNRRDDAASALEELVAAQPLLRITDSGLPPRLRALLDEVRARVSPAIARQHYQSGKQFFDAGDYDRALQEFALVVQIVADVGEQSSGALADLETLAAGFRDLTQRSIDAAKATSTPSAAVAVPEGDAGATAAAATIVPPVTVFQELPEYPRVLQSHTVGPVLQGVLEVVVTETGDVKSVTLIERIHPVYDSLLLAAAKHWKYHPATRNGKAIEFVKRIAVELQLQ